MISGGGCSSLLWGGVRVRYLVVMATHIVSRVATAALAAGMLLGGGCMTYFDEQQQQSARQEQELLRMQEQVRALVGRMEGVEMETQRMAREAEQLRRSVEASSQEGVRTLQPQVAELQRRVADLAAARERDKQAIIDDISKKMAAMLRSGGGGGSSRGAPVRSGGATEGYEHVVQSGETLSAIAQAYKVSASAILRENNLSNANMLREGQKLFIPKN